MRAYNITYFFRPEYENVTITISAKDFEDAVIFAKQYKPRCSFCVEEADQKEVE